MCDKGKILVKNKVLNYIKYGLIVAGILVLIVPIIIVLASGVGFGEIYSHIFLTISVGLFVVSTLLEIVQIKMANSSESIIPKIGIIIGFIVVAITFWF